jgi:Lectin C-type domain
VNDQSQKYAKHYFAPKFLRGSWIQAKMICESYGMDLAGFETNDEHNAVKQMVNQHKKLFTTYIFVDGMRSSMDNDLSKTDWWYSDSKKINYAMQWSPGEPNLHTQRCLCISSSNGLFFDIDCSVHYANQSFMCQNLIYF